MNLKFYGFGERKTPEPFVNACTSFLYLDSLVDPEAPVLPPSPAVEPVWKTRVTWTATERPLVQDNALVTALRRGVEATARDDGWAPLSAAGSAVERLAPIDPRNSNMEGGETRHATTGVVVIDTFSSNRSTRCCTYAARASTIALQGRRAIDPSRYRQHGRR